MRILIIYLLTILRLYSCSDEPHPYGRDQPLVNILRNGELAEFHGNLEFINKTFTHPLVKDRKVVVFSIIGAYREGKSFFLDYCLRYLYATYKSVNSIDKPIDPAFNASDWMGDRDEILTGFSWKHGSTGHTKGLMLWSDVFLYDAPDGEKFAIFVIDTQGLFEKKSTEEENAKIFSFSTLVSSIQIINIKERIQENQIAHLNTAIELATLITQKQNDKKKPERKPFQKLIFLLRDFADENYEFGYEGGQKYFKNFFESQDSEEGTEVLTRADVNRNSIRESFDQISCFLLSHPGRMIKDKRFKGQWGMLDTEFKENLEIVIESLLAPSKFVKKSVLNKELTAEKFRDIFLSLLQSYSTYKMPQVDNIFQVAVDNQMASIVKEEVKKYKALLMDGKIDFERVDFVEWLQNKHTLTKTLVIDNFMNADKIDDKPSEEKFKKILEDEIEEIFESWQKTTMEAFALFKTEKEMQAIVNRKLSEYRRKINENVTYEMENFVDFIKEKHEEVKSALIEEFMEEMQVYNDETKANKFREILSEEIEKNYQTWLESAMQHHEETKLRSLMSLELQNYRQAMDNESNFSRDDYEAHIDSKHIEISNSTIENFFEATRDSNDTILVRKIAENLEREIDAQFRAWRSSKIADYNRFVTVRQQQIQTKLKADVQSHLYMYESTMNANLTLDDRNFTLNLDQKHEEVKKQIIEQFSNQSAAIDATIFNQHLENLETALEQKYIGWKVQKVKDHEEHLQKEQEILDKEMELLIQNTVFKYNELMVENLTFDALDFESMIDKKHENVTKIIFEDFVGESQGMDEKYLNDLKAKIREIFQDLRQKKLREHQNVLDLKVDAIILRKVSDYRLAMELDIDFNKEDFEASFQSKHESEKLKAVQNFSQIQEVMESLNKNNSVQNLENGIDAASQTIKTSKMKAYVIYKEKNNEQIEIFFQLLVQTQLEAYKSDFLSGVNYELENFDAVNYQRHQKSTTMALNGFNETANQPEHRWKKDIYKLKLSTDIQKWFNEWKPEGKKENINQLNKKRLQRVEDMRKIADERFNLFKKNIWKITFTEAEFEKEGFWSDARNKFDDTAENEITSFKSLTNNLNEPAEQRQLASELDDRTGRQFETWKGFVSNMKVVNDDNVKARNRRTLRSTADRLFSKYKTDLESSKDVYSSTFPSQFESYHNTYKLTAITAFKSENANMKDTQLVQEYESILQEEIVREYTASRESGLEEYNTLRTVGKWVQWNNSRPMSGCPTGSILGGKFNGWWCCVARIDGLGGEYCPKVGHATVNYKGDVKTAANFEVLLHTNYKYVHNLEDDMTPIFNGGEMLCRDYEEFTNAQHVGRHHDGYCYEVHNGKKESQRHAWEYLVRG